MGITIIVSVIAVFVIIFAIAGFRVVQQGEVMIIERLGKYNRTLKSGINIIWPIIDKPRNITWRFVIEGMDEKKHIRFVQKSRIDMRETVYDFPKQNVITKDNVGLQINALLYFQIMDPVRAIYEIENLPDAIEKLTQTTLRNVIGELELDESLSSRDTINSKLRKILDEASNKWGVKVNRVELQDINPPGDIKEAMEKQMRAERDKRAAILTAEGLKQSKILEAEGFSESEIKRSKGEKESEILRAEGMAKARIITAEAEAMAIKMVSEAIERKNGDPVNYLIASKYIETLQEMVSGKDNKTVYIPFEATGLLSSLGGIKELLNK
jgi:regulator of protease activity HflC (stomatin/prohibitin superfamily)